MCESHCWNGTHSSYAEQRVTGRPPLDSLSDDSSYCFWPASSRLGVAECRLSGTFANVETSMRCPASICCSDLFHLRYISQYEVSINKPFHVKGKKGSMDQYPGFRRSSFPSISQLRMRCQQHPHGTRQATGQCASASSRPHGWATNTQYAGTDGDTHLSNFSRDPLAKYP